MRDRISSSVLARRLVQAGIDACLIALAWLLAFLLRFDPTIPDRYATLLAWILWAPSRFRLEIGVILSAPYLLGCR